MTAHLLRFHFYAAFSIPRIKEKSKWGFQTCWPHANYILNYSGIFFLHPFEETQANLLHIIIVAIIKWRKATHFLNKIKIRIANIKKETAYPNLISGVHGDRSKRYISCIDKTQASPSKILITVAYRLDICVSNNDIAWSWRILGLGNREALQAFQSSTLAFHCVQICRNYSSSAYFSLGMKLVVIY